MSSYRLWQITILCQVILTIEGQSGYFGSSGQYVCHCDGNCDVITGDCSGPCHVGWMGPSCQYANLANGASAFVSGRTPNTHRGRLVDGRLSTCRYTGYEIEHLARIVMKMSQWITWIQVKVDEKHLNKIEKVDITLRPNQNGDTTVCSSGYSRNTGTLYNIICDQPTKASVVEIRVKLQYTAYLYVCEVLISGGVNAAVRKQANQSSTYYDDQTKRIYGADLAVDGIISQNWGDNSCSHTGTCSPGDQLDWDLDLQGYYKITMVRIYNRNGQEFQLGGFILKARRPANALINLYTDPTSGIQGDPTPGPIVTLVVDPVVETNLIRITIPRCGVLSLCEVQVFSACSDGKYGFDCFGTCHCKDPSETCEKVFGICSSGCAPGYTGQGCGEECQQRYYGDDCLQPCSISCIDEICHHVNGSCTSGCVEGKQGDMCQEECENEFYGVNCSERCSENCKPSGNQRTCSIQRGQCYNGCQPGWETNTCKTKCSTGRYGLGCLSSCRFCLDDVCDHVTGTCKMGCDAGYMGDKCDELCENEFYGVNCSERCSENCRPYSNPNIRTCFETTGTCKRGCQSGWKTSTCKTKCRKERYGNGCSKRCSSSCRDGICHHVTGSCTSGCVEGKQGDMCKEDCGVGTYGPDCTFNCSQGCKTPLCSPTTGVCRDGCSPGWRGENCSLECSSGYYGDNCVSACSNNCNGGVCDNVNGECTQGCIAGYHGAHCTQECDSGTYGPSCVHKCADGCDGGQCNRSDGTCTCLGGWRGQNCDLVCEAGFYGFGCRELCSPYCEGSVCEGTQGLCLSCQSGWKGDRCQHEDADGMSVGVIAGIVVASLLIIALAVLIVFFIVRRKSPRQSVAKTVRYNNSPNGGKGKITIEKAATPAGSSQSSLLLAPSRSDLDNGEAHETYYNIAATSTSSTVTSVSDFPHYVRKWRLNKQHLFAEFQKLPKDLINDCNIAKASHNIMKNRYKNICAYDHSRVVLQVDPEDPDVGDYINACYIDTLKKQKAFIAAQGPNDVIINDFVRMLWELNIQKVVMLTNLFEEGKQKCHQYWPDEAEATFGHITVSVRKTTVHADYTVRKLSLTKEGSKPKQLTQFHFTAWPDKGVPRSAASLVDFRDKVMTSESSNKKPVVVHCSAGIGRTGTFIALQYLKEEAELRATQDIYTCVWSLRQQRVNMVQTKDQYVFIHEACLVSLITPTSTFTVEQFRQRYPAIAGDTVRLQNEFEILEEFPVKVDEDEFSVALNMKTKNRHSKILAGNSNRPVLTPNPEYEETSGTYINAVFIPSYDAPHKFIQTQSPVPGTVADIWRLVSDYDVGMIFMLDNYTHTDGDAAVYWPEIRSPIEVGPFHVECLTASQNNDVIVKNLELKQGESFKKVIHITSKFWSDDGLPPVDSFLQLVRMSKTKKSGSSVIVHCRSGAERSGLFCAVAAIIDRLDIDRTVAVPVVVGNVKAIRRQNIPDMSQYKFCYEAVAEYLGSEPVYSNTETGANDSAAPEMKDQEDANVYTSIDDEHIYSNQ